MTAPDPFLESRRAYYASREWALRKEEVHQRSNRVCENCHIRKATQVHHRTYEHFGNEPLVDLMDLCDRCHAWESGKGGREAANPAPRWAHAQGTLLRLYGLITEPDPDPDPALASLMSGWQAALHGSVADDFLHSLRIDSDVARRAAVGFADGTAWPKGKAGERRIVFPETDPSGELISIAALRLDDDHREGDQWERIGKNGRGLFGADALYGRSWPLIAADPIEVLALRCAGATDVVAVGPVAYWHWQWAINVARFTCMWPADQAQNFANQCDLLNKKVRCVGAGDYTSYAAALAHGELELVREAIKMARPREGARTQE